VPFPAAEQAAASQLRRHHFDEVVAAAGQVPASDVEAVAGTVLEPALHRIGHLL
jgi:hypothetical protein